MIGLKAAGSFSAYSAVFILLVIIKIPLYAQNKNTLEFSPAYSIKMFTADNQLSGTAFGWEMIYAINNNDKPRGWQRILRVQSIDFILNIKNMRKVNVLSADEEMNPLSLDTYALLAGLNIRLAHVGNTKISFSPAFGLGYLSQTYLPIKILWLAVM